VTQFGCVKPVVVQDVAAVAVLNALAAEYRPQSAHQHGQLILGPGWRCVAPQGVQQDVRRHRLALGQGQQVQGDPRLPAAEPGGLDAVDAEFAEEPHCERLHGFIKPPGSGSPLSAAARSLRGYCKVTATAC
jgi:hypothetical protein